MRQRRHLISVLSALVVVGVIALVWPRQTHDEPDLPPAAEDPTEDNDPVIPRSATVPTTDVTAPEPADQSLPGRRECKAGMTPYTKPTRTEINKIVDDAVVLLRSTQGYENMLAAALLSRPRDSNTAVEILNALGGEDTTDPHVLWTGLTMCEGGSIGCDYARAERNIRANHSSNSAFWIALAGNDLKEGRDDDALAKINAALAAPGFETYFAERYLLLDRAFAATTNWSAAERAFQIFEFDVSAPPGFRALVLKCETANVAAWATVCDQLVTKLQDANDISAQVHAYELELRLLESRGQPEEASALRERSVAAIVGVDIEESLVTATANLLLNDEVLLSRLLQDVESLGEIAALRQLTEDVARMRSSEQHDECKFIANPYRDL